LSSFEEKATNLCLVYISDEDGFVEIVEGEVQRMRWKRPPNVGQVTAPK